MKKIFLALITLLAGIGFISAQCPPAATSSSNVVLTQRVVKVGMLNGVFSVAANKKVAFSKGNLQYQGSTGTWRFAENQWDYIGNAVGNTTAALADRENNVHWIDLFGWGTSGYSSKYPYMIITATSNYPSAIAGNNYDWGRYNAGQLGSGWFTLSRDEWNYLLTTRRNADNAYLYAMGKVHGKNGLIILPDGWRQANSAMAGTLTLGASSSWPNNLSDDNWAALEKEGAVFLPAAGYRNGTTVFSAESHGYYWSSTSRSSAEAHDLTFTSNVTSVYPSDYYELYRGCSVRLVQVIP